MAMDLDYYYDFNGSSQNKLSNMDENYNYVPLDLSTTDSFVNYCLPQDEAIYVPPQEECDTLSHSTASTVTVEEEPRSSPAKLPPAKRPKVDQKEEKPPTLQPKIHILTQPGHLYNGILYAVDHIGKKKTFICVSVNNINTHTDKYHMVLHAYDGNGHFMPLFGADNPVINDNGCLQFQWESLKVDVPEKRSNCHLQWTLLNASGIPVTQVQSQAFDWEGTRIEKAGPRVFGYYVKIGHVVPEYVPSVGTKMTIIVQRSARYVRELLVNKTAIDFETEGDRAILFDIPAKTDRSQPLRIKLISGRYDSPEYDSITIKPQHDPELTDSDSEDDDDEIYDNKNGVYCFV